MSYFAWIKDLKTGETRKCEMQDCAWEEGCEFLWAEGNFGCDCNRALFFARANDAKPDEMLCAHDDFPEGRYQVVSIKLDDGTEVYAEVGV